MIGAEPTLQSLAFRAKLAQFVSPLRRVRSRTPFFRLAAHRIPTLWSLYRGLLRHSPTEQVRFDPNLLAEFEINDLFLLRSSLGFVHSSVGINTQPVRIRRVKDSSEAIRYGYPYNLKNIVKRLMHM
jgi:hypothetical protein